MEALKSQSDGTDAIKKGTAIQTGHDLWSSHCEYTSYRNN